MNAKPITRREALAAGFGAVVIANAGAAPVPKANPNGSWVGRTVLARTMTTTATPATQPDSSTPPDGVRGVCGLDDISYTVKAEKDGQVEFLLSDGTMVHLKRGDVVELADAVEFFTGLLKKDAKDVFAHISRGWASYQLGKLDKAIEDFDAYLKLIPGEFLANNPPRWLGLVQRGLALAELGKFPQALKDLDEAIAGGVGAHTGYLNRGFTRALMGDYEKAIADYDWVIEHYPLYLLASNNKAWVLATCPEEKLRNGAETVKLAKDACERTKDREGMYLDTLAAAHAEAGKFDDAVKAQEKALEDKSYTIRYGEGGRQRLQLYKDKKPFRTQPVK